jgi:tyrosine ammonia-lyase
MQHDSIGKSGAEILLNGRLTLDNAHAIAVGHLRPVLTQNARARCAQAEARLQRALAERRHIYGLTTGFGPLANRLVAPEDGVQLQQNLIHHLASGIGPDFDWTEARAIVLARLNSILQGVSGASKTSIALLERLLQSDLAPAIPCRGTVGASGDLTPLAHMVLCLQGRAPFLRRDGTALTGPEALAELDCPPLDLSQRDGLALVNGTSAMTGMACCSACEAQRLIDWAIALTAGLAEVMGGRTEAWHPALAEQRPHPGQLAVTAALRQRVAGSAALVTRPIAERRLSPEETGPEDVIGQDAYTLRCAPQVIGAVQDTLNWHNQVVEIELNAATDNPIFPETVPDDANVPALHGGNFMGQHVALVSDALSGAICVLAGLAERQIARVTDERLNGGLPAFLHAGRAGLNSGLMGAQVTATALLTEMRSQGPVSPQSISTNGANQDVVSLGTIAARHTRRQLRRTSEILAILALSVTQGLHLAQRMGRGGHSPSADALQRQIRQISPALSEDRPLSQDIRQLAGLIRTTDPA